MILLALVFCHQALQHFAGGGSVEEIADHEAAVVLDYMTGEGRVVVDPGFQTVTPRYSRCGRRRATRRRLP